ncbi:MBL fold metallo-hydrolase [Wukongibacter baidiensis]|uniref:MBL fold metallo-hydrolase n=1 Tax=Wukongibacter baidiensis TaxID=1723361 RepID=UPI003D7FEE43
MNKGNSKVIPITFGMVSAFIIKGEKTILIDTGQRGSGKKILTRMEEEGIDPSQLSLIVITHGHNDHFGSASFLKERTGAPIAIHKNDADNLRKGINGRLQPTRRSAKFLSILMGSGEKPKVKGLEPDILIEDKFDLRDYGVDGEIIWTPGHTKGSVSVVLGSGEAFIGDLLMTFRSNRIPKYPLWAYDLSQIKKSIKEIINMSPRILYAGHGGPFTPESVIDRFKADIAFNNKI